MIIFKFTNNNGNISIMTKINAEVPKTLLGDYVFSDYGKRALLSVIKVNSKEYKNIISLYPQEYTFSWAMDSLLTSGKILTGIDCYDNPKTKYMKKWWLEKTLEDGRRLSGWINTTAENKEDFPETISGSFWTMKDSNGDCYGLFELGDGNYEGNYTFISVKPKDVDIKNFDPCTRIGAEAILKAQEVLPSWGRIELRIEDCLSIKGTYIDSYGGRKFEVGKIS